MAPTTTQLTDQFTDQLNELESKALGFLKDAKAPAGEYVGKVAEALASRLPENRPELLSTGIDTLVTQVDFAKKVLDAQVALVKTVLDAAVKPVRPARRPTAAAKASAVRAA